MTGSAIADGDPVVVWQRRGPERRNHGCSWLQVPLTRITTDGGYTWTNACSIVHALGGIVARGFSAEADMLGFIAASVPALAGPDAVAVFEVPSAAGVPDVVAAVFDDEAIASWVGGSFVTDQAGVAALLALSDARANGRALDASQVAAAIGVSVAYSRSRVLPGLAGRGLAVMTGPGRWVATSEYRSPTVRLVTIEAKLRNWRKGLSQAARHVPGADAAWLVLDAAHARPAEQGTAWFRALGVGLALLDRDGTLTPLLEPSAFGVLRVRRELLAQRLACMRSCGAVSGPPARVFGRYLAPTTEPDPRIQGASARCCL